MKLTVYNRQKARIIPKETLKLIERAAKLCVKKENFPYSCEAFITLTDNATIKEYNSQHRGIDKPTDVLSFPLIEFIDGKPNILPGDVDPDTNRVSLGDILVSVEKACEQAESYGHSEEREFAFLAVHGMLHLLGYDHESKEDEQTMFGIQNEILDGMGLGRE